MPPLVSKRTVSGPNSMSRPKTVDPCFVRSWCVGIAAARPVSPLVGDCAPAIPASIRDAIAPRVRLERMGGSPVKVAFIVAPFDRSRHTYDGVARTDDRRSGRFPVGAAGA